MLLILTISLQLYEGLEVNGIAVSKEETPGDDKVSKGCCSPGGDASTILYQTHLDQEERY